MIIKKNPKLCQLINTVFYKGSMHLKDTVLQKELAGRSKSVFIRLGSLEPWVVKIILGTVGSLSFKKHLSNTAQYVVLATSFLLREPSPPISCW